MTDSIRTPPDWLSPQALQHHLARLANRYEKTLTLEREIGNALMERLDYQHLKPQRIIDIGAATGWMTRLLLSRYPRASVYALDNSQPLLSQGKRQTAWYQRLPGRNRVHFLCGNAQQLPLADNSVDLLVSSLLLYCCNDPEAVLAECTRVLRPQGVFLFSTFGPDTLKELRQSWAAVDEYSHVYRFIDMHDIGDRLLQQGLVDPVMDVDWLCDYVMDVHTLLNRLKSTSAPNVMAGRRRGLSSRHTLQKLADAYEVLRTSDGLPVTWEVVYGFASGKKSVLKRPSSKNDAVFTVPLSAIGRQQQPDE